MLDVLLSVAFLTANPNCCDARAMQKAPEDIDRRILVLELARKEAARQLARAVGHPIWYTIGNCGNWNSSNNIWWHEDPTP